MMDRRGQPVSHEGPHYMVHALHITSLQPSVGHFEYRGEEGSKGQGHMHSLMPGNMLGLLLGHYARHVGTRQGIEEGIGQGLRAGIKEGLAKNFREGA
jgi:hypothetical protein